MENHYASNSSITSTSSSSFSISSTTPSSRMQNSCLDMDIEEDWEFLPDTNKGFLGYGHGSSAENNLLLNELIVDMNYFICPLMEDDVEGERPPSPQLALRSPDPAPDGESDDKFFKDIGVVLPPPVILVSPHHHQSDAASQILFKKLSVADMKAGDSSPMSNAGWAAAVIFSGDDGQAPAEDPPSPEEDAIRKKARGFAAWRWRLAGIGAFCSMGAAAAAATFCILVFGGGGGGRPQQRRRIQFSICADEKRMKEVVQQATRLNQAMLTVSGAASRADISFGGYFASA